VDHRHGGGEKNEAAVPALEESITGLLGTLHCGLFNNLDCSPLKNQRLEIDLQKLPIAV
jgi:hypothetical protein